MPYDPTIWQTGDVITADKLNKIEQALVDLYEKVEGDVPTGYVVVAPEQSVTVTTGGVALTLESGYTLPDTMPNTWLVTVDGNTLEYDDNSGGYMYTGTNVVYLVGIDIDEEVLAFAAMTVNMDNPVPGTYTVSIYEPDGK